MTCKTHPDAPHGFDRGASHTLDRYVCECEFWEEPKMNERIKQLAKQAGFNPYNYEGGNLALFEKFAQLIVRECASRVDNILREKKDGGGTMGDDIRDYFGVEE